MKVDPKAPVPGEMPKSDLHKKKFENEPKEEDQKKLKQNKPAASVEFKIEEDSFDDADVAEHIKSDPAKEKEEKAKKEAAESGTKLPEKKKTDEPIKNIKDMHEELIKSIRDSDSSLRIEVSKLNDDEIDEQIEEHKASLEVAEMRRKSAEAMAKKIKEEDEAEAKANKAALIEKEKKDKLNQDFTISTTKLEEGQTEKAQPQEEKVVAKKPEPKKVETP